VCGLDAKPGADSKFIVYPRVNEDFILNLQKTNPLDYTFYGICVKSCPPSLFVVCNYGSVAPAAAQADLLTCMTTPAAASAGSVPDCGAARDNCWVNAQSTASIMFHCIPQYNVTNAKATACSYPPSVVSADDPSCILATDTQFGSVQRPAKPNLLFDQLNTVQQIWGRWFGDLARAWWAILLVSVGLGLLLGFVYVQMLKYLTGCMVWTTVIMTNLVIMFLTGYFYYKAGLVVFAVPASLTDKISSVGGAAYYNASLAYLAQAQQAAATSGLVQQDFSGPSTTDVGSYKAIAYTSTGVLVIVLCLTVAMRAAINTAVEVIKIGSDALAHNASLLFFPCTNVVAMGLFLVWWVFVAACLESAGTVTLTDMKGAAASGLQQLSSQYGVNATAALGALKGLNTSFTTVQGYTAMNYLMIYHLFGMLWTVNFLAGISMMAVSGTICAWYFSKPAHDAQGNLLPAEKYEGGAGSHLFGALARTLRFYLGSVAVGSFLIAVVQMVRIAFAYLQNKLKEQAEKSMVLKFLLYCVQCLLSCLESLVKVVTRNSFIFIQLKGDSFCSAGGRVFSLIVKHGSVFAIVNVLGDIILFMGKVGISCACGWGAFVLVENVAEFKPGGANQLSSTWMPVLVTIFFAYFVASGFMDVFSLTIDSILVCYVTDCDEHGGAPAHMDGAELDARGRAELKKHLAEEAAAAKGGKDKAAEAPAGAPAPAAAAAPAKASSPMMIGGARGARGAAPTM